MCEDFQIEPGKAATPYDRLRPDAQMMECQRYLRAFSASSPRGYERVGFGRAMGTQTAMFEFPFQVRPRVPPTGMIVSAFSDFVVSGANDHTYPVTIWTFFGAGYQGAKMIAGAATSIFSSVDATELASFTSTAKLLFTGVEL